MRGLGVSPEEIILSGGGTRSALWKQMLADVFSSRCSMVNAIEGAAYGAAVLAAVGCGAHPTVESACGEWIRKTESVEPGEQRGAYGKYYSIYRSLYPALKDAFQSISESSEG